MEKLQLFQHHLLSGSLQKAVRALQTPSPLFTAEELSEVMISKEQKEKNALCSQAHLFSEYNF